MSFRIEEKMFIKNENLFSFQNFLYSKNFKKYFPARIIESVYFDNENLEMFNDSIEGVVPRKKVRIRRYPESKDNNFYLEEKFSSVEGRYKKRKIITKEMCDKKINYGILDRQYGVCFPKIKINYLRDYYVINDVRVTIDRNIKYFSLKTNLVIGEQKIIVELKTNILKNIDDFQNDFPFQKIRFSKYCYAIETMIKNF